MATWPRKPTLQRRLGGADPGPTRKHRPHHFPGRRKAAAKPVRDLHSSSSLSTPPSSMRNRNKERFILNSGLQPGRCRDAASPQGRGPLDLAGAACPPRQGQELAVL
ncbi:hypothetical protein PspLS_10138 [Pyricularia sp. CBS 133598]|nr:hypothetical protein PspLS_10138 [Pyricularia sp. CBS 133598]